MLWAGKLVKKETPTVVEIEKFDVFYAVGNWENQKISRWKRSVFKWGVSKSVQGNIVDGSKWVIKKYTPKAVKNMEELGMALEDHGRKQV